MPGERSENKTANIPYLAFLLLVLWFGQRTLTDLLLLASVQPRTDGACKRSFRFTKRLASARMLHAELTRCELLSFFQQLLLRGGGRLRSGFHQRSKEGRQTTPERAQGDQLQPHCACAPHRQRQDARVCAGEL